MYKVLLLNNKEFNAIDEIIRVYKLPFEALEGDQYGDSSYIADLEEDKSYDLYDGIGLIIEAVECDDGELYNNISSTHKAVFENLCKELDVPFGNDKHNNLNEANNRLEVVLPDKKFKLVAEKDMPRRILKK